MRSFIRNIPKAELHIHIEGTLEPELMLKIAKRNGVSLRFSAVDDVRKAYTFSNLPSFLSVYYEATSILLREQDFYDVTRAYLEKAHAQNVRHTEMFFDPQSHTERGVPFETVISGIHRAQSDARLQLGITSKLILCFLRHLSVDSAMEALKEAIPFKHWIVGVGLDSAEAGHPPEKFIRVFEKSLAEGFLTVAHAGEDGPGGIYMAGAETTHGLPRRSRCALHRGRTPGSNTEGKADALNRLSPFQRQTSRLR